MAIQPETPVTDEMIQRRGVFGGRGMNGGQMEEHHAPMRPGDVVTSTSGLVDCPGQGHGGPSIPRRLMRDGATANAALAPATHGIVPVWPTKGAPPHGL